MGRMVWHDHGMRTQVTFDCSDPHAQSAFWAAVFGSQVEYHSELVDHLVGAGRLPAEDMITIAGRSAFRDVAACSDPTASNPGSSSNGFPKARRARTASI